MHLNVEFAEHIYKISDYFDVEYKKLFFLSQANFAT